MLIESGANIKKAAEEIGINNSTAKDLARRLRGKRVGKVKKETHHVKVEALEQEQEEVIPDANIEIEAKSPEATELTIRKEENAKHQGGEVYPFQNWWHIGFLPGYHPVTMGHLYYPLI